MRATLWSLTFTRPGGFQIKFAQSNRKDTFAICQLYGLGWKITSSVFSGLCALLVNSLPAKVDRNVLRVLSWGEITGLHQNNQGEWLLPELECNHNAEVKISFKCIPMEDCGRESSNKNIKIPAEVDRYVWKHTGNRSVNEEVSTFLLQYIFSHFAESKNLGRYRRILLLLIGWVLVFPCSLEMVFFFFLVSRTSNHVEKAILNVVTSLHSNFGAHYLFSWFFFTAPSAACSIRLCLLSTESPFPPLPVCSNCRNSSYAVGLCLRWRYRSSIKHTHTHTAIYLCCL